MQGRSQIWLLGHSLTTCGLVQDSCCAWAVMGQCRSTAWEAGSCLTSGVRSNPEGLGPQGQRTWARRVGGSEERALRAD